MKICPVGAKFHMDRCDKAISHFSQLCECAYKLLLGMVSTYAVTACGEGLDSVCATVRT